VVIGLLIFVISTYFAVTYTDKHSPISPESPTESLAEMIGFLIGAWIFSYLGISFLIITIMAIVIVLVRMKRF
jgi:hypothetical protein